MHAWRAIKSLVLVGMGVFLLYQVGKDRVAAAARRKLYASGEKAVGRVLELNRKDRGNTWRLMYMFDAPDRRGVVVVRDVSGPNGLQPGKPVDVRFDPKEPSVCVTEAEFDYTPFGMVGPWGLAAISFAFIAAGVALFRWHARQAAI